MLIIGPDPFISQSSPDHSPLPRIDFSYYEISRPDICSLICVLWLASRATIFPISKTKVLRSNSARFSFFANISVYLLFVIVWNCNYYLQRRKIENLDNAWEIGARLLQTTSLSLNLDFFKRIFIELLTLWPCFDALFVN